MNYLISSYYTISQGFTFFYYNTIDFSIDIKYTSKNAIIYQQRTNRDKRFFLPSVKRVPNEAMYCITAVIPAIPSKLIVPVSQRDIWVIFPGSSSVHAFNLYGRSPWSRSDLPNNNPSIKKWRTFQTCYRRINFNASFWLNAVTFYYLYVVQKT